MENQETKDKQKRNNQKDRCNYRQLNTSVGVMCGWCLTYCTGVVLNTVRESATPDSTENEQADAGSRLFSEGFSVRRVVVYLFIGRA